MFQSTNQSYFEPSVKTFASSHHLVPSSLPVAEGHNGGGLRFRQFVNQRFDDLNAGVTEGAKEIDRDPIAHMA